MSGNVVSIKSLKERFLRTTKYFKIKPYIRLEMFRKNIKFLLLSVKILLTIIIKFSK